ncbi:GSCFA domain-containing protein [Bradyrhizobium sp. RP6]|uniref:GSCFA domain-containing protein n=1 Tax=Bradyrhizobium sp. RP6 TaxID=2489596 RepID=UPI000F545C93|nr:GSCFA domain-containing protein [Bradyrhizobium sp. RP6]RQH12659.1 hypothetical protein EHH60_14300 [Bradyrhizobium sp. RP6]
MAAKVRTLREIIAARRSNKHTVWFDGEVVDTAAMRLLSGEYVKIGVAPKFKISSSAKVFTIGSCFARNVEDKLAERGIDVVSKRFSLPADAYLASLSPAAALYKYNTHSIESEVLSATGRVTYPNLGLIDAGEGLWWDPLATGTKLGDYETVSGIRLQIQKLTSGISKCDAVVITLGLNEVWHDLETGLYMNVKPPMSLIRRYSERFGVVISDVEDNLASLERTISAIRGSAGDTKIILTVSPAPMAATLTSMDVISANTLSKAMLRVCAHTVADRYDFVDYFPSYEIVMNSPRDMTWFPDQIHVKDEVVRFITNYFIEQYVIE